ncbi:MAG: hypothetical protein ABJF23_25875 [Bryobacteraceae bacterium]
MATLLRLYSYLYHLVLALILFAISGVAIASDVHTLNLQMFPWKGDELIHWVFYGSIVGLAATALAMTGVFRYLFPLWTLIVFVMMVRGFLVLPYTFTGKDEFNAVLWLIAGAFGAFLSSLTLFKRDVRGGRRSTRAR